MVMMLKGGREEDKGRRRERKVREQFIREGRVKADKLGQGLDIY
jgi:hypothetical protein